MMNKSFVDLLHQFSSHVESCAKTFPAVSFVKERSIRRFKDFIISENILIQADCKFYHILELFNDLNGNFDTKIGFEKKLYNKSQANMLVVKNVQEFYQVFKSLNGYINLGTCIQDLHQQVFFRTSQLADEASRIPPPPTTQLDNERLTLKTT